MGQAPYPKNDALKGATTRRKEWTSFIGQPKSFPGTRGNLPSLRLPTSAARKIENAWDGVTHDYTRKKHIIYTAVMMPPNAPQEYADRSLLWNSVEWNKTKANAQLARSIELALPAELTHEQNIALIRALVQKLFVDKGMCADIAFHDKDDGNPHAHILLTMRPLTPDGKWGDKSRLEYIIDADGNRIPARQKGAGKHTKFTQTIGTTAATPNAGALLPQMPSI